MPTNWDQTSKLGTPKSIEIVCISISKMDDALFIASLNVIKLL